MSQVVEVALWGGRPYAYVWDGDPPLKVGDRVVVPAPAHSRSRPGNSWVQQVGPVVKIGSDYPGPLEAITERA